jgi:hypothetical protein
VRLLRYRPQWPCRLPLLLQRQEDDSHV